MDTIYDKKLREIKEGKQKTLEEYSNPEDTRRVYFMGPMGLECMKERGIKKK